MANSSSTKGDLWGKILNLKPRNDGPWCCIGDINEMTSITEKEGSRPIEPIWLNLLRDFLNVSELMDQELKCFKVAWISNPRDGIITKQKIGRILVNWGRRDLYPLAIGLALPIANSDHSPLVLLLNPPAACARYFCYESYWEEHEECRNMVKSGWSRSSSVNEGWDRFSTKVKDCKKFLLAWHKFTTIWKLNQRRKEALKKMWIQKVDPIIQQENKMKHNKTEI